MARNDPDARRGVFSETADRFSESGIIFGIYFFKSARSISGIGSQQEFFSVIQTKQQGLMSVCMSGCGQKQDLSVSAQVKNAVGEMPFPGGAFHHFRTGGIHCFLFSDITGRLGKIREPARVIAVMMRENDPPDIPRLHALPCKEFNGCILRRNNGNKSGIRRINILRDLLTCIKKEQTAGMLQKKKRHRDLYASGVRTASENQMFPSNDASAAKKMKFHVIYPFSGKII